MGILVQGGGILHGARKFYMEKGDRIQGDILYFYASIMQGKLVIGFFPGWELVGIIES